MSGSSSIPSGVISFGKGVKVDSGLSSYFLLVSLNTPNKLIIKRKIDPKAIKLKSSEAASGNSIRQIYNLIEGIDQEIGKKVTTLVKSSKLKVQAKIQGSELRISGGKRDDLQKIIELIKELNLEIPIQFINFRD